MHAYRFKNSQSSRFQRDGADLDTRQAASFAVDSLLGRAEDGCERRVGEAHDAYTGYRTFEGCGVATETETQFLQ